MSDMIKQINNIFSKLPHYKNRIFWIFVALIIKSSFFTFKVFIEDSMFKNTMNTATFASESGDAYSYIEPIEGLLSNGTYSGIFYDDYRMPGYGFPYLILRLFLDETQSLNGLVLFQLLLSAISVYVLALLSLHVFKHHCFFYTTFILYAVSTYVSLYDHVLLTESLCASTLIFSAYYLVTANKSSGKLLFSGLLLTWCIFLRPVIAPLLFIYVIYLLLQNANGWKSAFKNSKYVLLFLLPFIIIDGAWIIRNYNLYNRIIPLSKTVYYPSTESSYLVSLYGFMNAYGGSIVSWEPGADINFFILPPTHLKKQITIEPPAYIYTSKYNYDSLVAVKALIDSVNDSELNPQLRKELELQVIEKLNTYTISIKKEKPVLFYLTSRLKVVKNFLVHNGTYNLFQKSVDELNAMAFVIKLFYIALYLFVAFGGLAGSILLFIKGIQNPDYFLISSVGLYIAFVFPIVLKFDEYRYFVPGYPFFLISGIFMLSLVTRLFLKSQK